MNFDGFLQEAAFLEGLEWRKYRRRSARHAVERRITELGLTGFDAYLDLLSSAQEERAGLADLMRVTVSRFFRDRECWLDLADQVVPALLAGRATGDTIRAWSAGCCGGEEPYTLAMVWLERIAPSQPERAIEIIASDIDEPSLERARAARFAKGSLREIPPGTLARFFTRERDTWCLAGEVKQLVRIERRNVMSDPLPYGMDLVLCRNLVFTYYRGDRLVAAMSRLREALRPGGVLMVGRRERLPGAASAYFEPWPACTGFFRRKV